MDKYEYNIKTEQVKKLIRKKEYEEAAKVADTMDFSKIKNNAFLITVADVYEVIGEFDKARDVLSVAYERSQLGRQIAYRLTRVSVKRKDLEDALDYYEDFVDVAPRDVSRYILQYEISKLKEEPIEKQIEILEAYLEDDMDDKWTFELAKLYHKAGNVDRCVELCDTIILWFNEGKYVDRAMELKMLHVPLTKSQQEKYDSRWAEREGINVEDIKIKEVAVDNKYDTYNIQAEIARSMVELLGKEGSSEKEIKEEPEALKENPNDDIDIDEDLENAEYEENAIEYEDEADIDEAGIDEAEEEGIEETASEDMTEVEFAGSEDITEDFSDGIDGNEYEVEDGAADGDNTEEAVEDEKDNVEEALTGEEGSLEGEALEDDVKEYDINNEPTINISKINEDIKEIEKLDDTKIIPDKNVIEFLRSQGVSTEEEPLFMTKNNIFAVLDEMRNSNETDTEVNIGEELEEEAFEDDEQLEGQITLDELLNGMYKVPDDEDNESDGEEADEPVDDIEEDNSIDGFIADMEAKEKEKAIENSATEEDLEILDSVIEEAIENAIGAIVEDEMNAATEEIALNTETTQELENENEEPKTDENAEEVLETEELEELVDESAKDFEEETEDLEEVEKTSEEADELVEDAEDLEGSENSEATADDNVADETSEYDDVFSEFDDGLEYVDDEEDEDDELAEDDEYYADDEDDDEFDEDDEDDEDDEYEDDDDEYADDEELDEEQQSESDGEPKEKITVEESKKLLRDFLNHYAGVEGLDKQVIKVFKNMLKNNNENNDFLCVMGDVKSGKTTLAMDIIKLVSGIRNRDNYRVAKVNGMSLSGKNVNGFLKKLGTCDVVIEKAASIEPGLFEEVINLFNESEIKRIVVFEDERSVFDKYLAKHENVANNIDNVIKLKHNKVRDWARVAVEYAAEQGYTIDEMGMLALHAKIDQLYAITLVIHKNHVEQIIDLAIENAERKSLGKFVKGIFKKKSETSVLTENDFMTD